MVVNEGPGARPRPSEMSRVSLADYRAGAEWYGVFTAGHFNEIKAVLIYEKGKSAPLLFFRLAPPHFYA